MSFTENMKKSFNATADHLLGNLKSGEEANINLSAEESLFVRFNGNKVRQNTHVEQRTVGLLLQKDGKTANLSFSITGNIEEDKKRADFWLAQARQECDLLPEDPYQVPLKNNGTSDSTFQGDLLPDEKVIEAITHPAQGSDLAGLYCGGTFDHGE
ncbi:hypothetical protein [Bdellovibrio bacteriovorus]|uniref:hypothetical protein n=1 Tax=Bdellovibrio bacteriovorus TaxID=959 RepID=UPI0035A82B61